MLVSNNIFVTIHGHFYQPPRENPWTEHIERQPSAAPFHDWNERINHECYHANCFARIMNPKGEINQIVNNFEQISFNIGPTLMHWVKEKSPATYKAIIEADMRSREHNNGHGNAIAQAYNHTILPLASDEDKYLQIKWGIDDFKSHFKRPPEAIWLAETAINQDTIDVLVEFDLKYVILSPYQACRYREIDGNKWTDVSAGTIDTTMPYRHYSRDKKRSIDIFFYNHAISSAIGFEHLLTNSYRLVEKFQQFSWDADRPILISACTDGESYGHHEKFGEMCLAHFFQFSAPKSGLQLTNYGAFLEKNPPIREVQIKYGANGEGTAWSCAHGVGRWTRNCGCSDGGLPSWNQHWRMPLRHAFNWLQKTILQRGEEMLLSILPNIRSARLEYFDVALNRDEKSQHAFLSKFTNNVTLSEDQKILILRFFESWHQCQLMFTSCAWFFADIDRLEPVQNMKYAARAIQLVQKYFNYDLEAAFLQQLELAHSNNASSGTGKDIYLREVKPSIINYKMIVGNYAIESYILKQFNRRNIYGYKLEPVALEKRKNSNDSVHKGMVWLTDTYTGEKRGYIYFLFMESLRDVRCYILNNKESLEFNIAPVQESEDDIRAMAGRHVYSLQDLFIENREQLIQLAFSQEMKSITTMLESVYDKQMDLLETFHAVDQPIPDILKSICEHVLTNRVDNILANLRNEDNAFETEGIIDMFKTAKRLHFNIQSDKLSQELNTFIEQQFKIIATKPDAIVAQEILPLLDIAKELTLPIDCSSYATIVYKLIHNHPWADGIPEEIQQLAHRLNVAIPAPVESVNA